MTRSGADYLEGLRNHPRCVYVNGERVEDVTVHPAFAGTARTVAHLYDLARDPVLGKDLTVPSQVDGRPINASWLTPHSREDLVRRRAAIRTWAEASYGFLGRSPDHVASFFAAYAGSAAFFARGG